MHSDGGSWLRCSRCATPSKADINQTTADFTGRESDACHELPGNRRTRLCWHMPGVCVSQAQSSRKACQVVASCVAAGTVTARASQARVAKTDMAIREGEVNRWLAWCSDEQTGMLQQRPTRASSRMMRMMQGGFIYVKNRSTSRFVPKQRLFQLALRKHGHGSDKLRKKGRVLSGQQR
ncbi:unnamed protein product [Effrenium voratum]|nr:unnamed protein product [Effrenium voratum]